MDEKMKQGSKSVVESLLIITLLCIRVYQVQKSMVYLMN